MYDLTSVSPATVILEAASGLCSSIRTYRSAPLRRPFPFVAMAHFGRSKSKFLEKFLDLSEGIPSHDRFNAIFAAIKPAEFEKCLVSWITTLHEITDGQVVAIDGKTLRRSFDAASSKAAIHMVSAWATANHISLGQRVIDKKSNEITAIPKLLEILDISGCFVTIDAMGCQTKIASKIVDSGADYVLAVKGNQKTLHSSIRRHFEDHLQDDFARTSVRRHWTFEQGHGREETREYFISKVPDGLADKERWPHLAAIGMAVNSTVRGGKETRDVRYYILMARSEKNVTLGYLNSSATQQRKKRPRMRRGRFAIDWSFRRVTCLSSSFVLA